MIKSNLSKIPSFYTMSRAGSAICVAFVMAFGVSAHAESPMPDGYSSYQQEQRQQKVQKMKERMGERWEKATPAEKKQMKEKRAQRMEKKAQRKKEMRAKWESATPEQKEEWLNRNSGKSINDYTK